MKSTRTITLSLLPLLSNLPTATPLTWEFDPSTATCDGSPFSASDLSITCNGSPSCTLGDTAYITGNVTAWTAFDEGTYVILQPCVLTQFGDYCPKKYSYSAGGVCNEWLSAEDGQQCGNAGDYDVDYSIDIPNKLPDYLSWLSYASSVVTVKIVLEQEEECEVDAEVVDGNGYAMVFSMLGFALGVVGAGAYVRRRQGAEVQKQQSGRAAAGVTSQVEMKEGLGGDYVEMLNGNVGSAVV